jgi:hypothetical protein
MSSATINPPKKSASLAPMQGERQDQFFDRASRALRKSIPSVNRRTVEVLRMWKESANAAEMNDRAENQFPESEYVHFGPRCIFLEHTIPGGEQQEKIVYDRDALQKLVNWANYRIADSATYAAISDGHTPDETERAAGKAAPDVLGYAGPFYLGLLGDMEPKWSIYADEWVHKADLERFKRLQRRSPEVWCSEPMESRTMDPIAALGAETPRLDSGMNPYSRCTDGKMVMRYSAAGGPMVMAGPNNSYIPGDKPKTTVDYSGASKMDMSVAPAKPDLGSVVAEAFQALLPSLVQSINQSMSMDPADNTDEPDAPLGEDTVNTDEVDNVVAESPEAPVVAEEVAVDDPDDLKYKAMGADCYAAYQAGKSKSKYSRREAPKVDKEVHAMIAKQQNQLIEQSKQIKALQETNEKTVRYHKRSEQLNSLANQFDFDPEEELEITEDMNDGQFDRHATKVITKYAKRDDVTSFGLFVDPDPADEAQPTRYSKGSSSNVSAAQIERYSREAADNAARKNGEARKKVTTFEAEYEAICKRHGVAV